MQILRSDRHSRVRPRALVAALLLTFVSSLVGSAAPAAPAAGPVVRLSGPDRVAVGEPITVSLSLDGAQDVGGYEAMLLFDTGSARFAGFDRRANGLGRDGRGTDTLGPVELPEGVGFGLYSCPVSDCASGEGERTDDGPSGKVSLGTISLTPSRGGLLQLALANLVVVDTDGDPIAVTAPPSIVVEVAGSDRPIAAPAAPYNAGVSGAADPITDTDITGDGQVTDTDARLVGLDWSLARFRSDPCDAALAPSDATGDGCVDVADLVAVSADLTEDEGGGGFAPAAVATVFVSTFVVTSTGDQQDAAINGTCATATGTCTLRAAVQEANAGAGADLITFNIPGTGVREIALGSQISFTDSAGVTIDGYTQPGSSVNTDPLASNAVIRIAITGPGDDVEVPGFFISTPNNLIRGLAMYELWRKIWLAGPNAAFNVVSGNFIGTDPAGDYQSDG
ncbi:MAG TPA: hypothetical protein VD763_02480, partial [Candidatus Saccharimonadales bacterium]|nr:hypothetical protein [Candidatus Saccharimonadales bacterium]